jgi:peptidoglycan/xylan/chitin deacetylase (PgdA/CDA1 family)
MKILSLFWHNVLPDPISPTHLDRLHTTVSMFRDHIRFIAANFTPISISDFVESATNPDLLRSYRMPPVLLGFDDGFRNVITHALPILTEFKTPAVLFVIGETIDNQGFVPFFVEIAHFVRKTEKRRINYNHITIDLSSREGYVKLGHSFEASFRACNTESDRQKLLTDLAELLGVDRPTASDLDEDLRFVTKEDLAAFNPSSLMTVASHAMTHRHLDILSYEEQIFELKQSDMLLRANCPAYCPVISYPGGGFDADTVDIAKGIYQAGFAVFDGSSYSNRYAYPRIGIDQVTMNELPNILSRSRLKYIFPLKRFLHAIGIRRSM